jgi:twitching motility protein PilT
MDLRALLAKTIELGGSDLHLKVDAPPTVRIDGELLPLELPQVTDEDTERVLAVITERTPRRYEHFMDTGDLDTAFTTPGVGRFRVNGFRQRGSISFAFRYVPAQVPTLEGLGLPPGITRLADEQRGLILVTGATGAGKTTTLSAMIDRINKTRRQHVVTLEDPIEIIHRDHDCIVQQREVGLDVDSFLEGMRRVLRQDPDVILIGELRDEESARVALQAGESGHLVLSTMHTLDARETVGRLIELFPPTKQMLVRQVMSSVFRGVISQRLLPRIGGGRVAAVELMVTTARIAEMIREPNKTDGITKAIEEGGVHQMQTFQQHLVQLVLDEVVDEETAANAASNRHDFELALGRAKRAKEAAAIAGGAGVSDPASRKRPAGADSLRVA